MTEVSLERPALAALMLAMLAAACGSVQVSPAPGSVTPPATSVPSPWPTHADPPDAPPPPTGSAPPASVSTPEARPSPTAQPTSPRPSAATAEALVVEWELERTQGLGLIGYQGLSGSAIVLNDRFVVVGSREDDEGERPAIWTSQDGFSWRPSTLDEGSGTYGEVVDVAAGRTGAVAIGSTGAPAIWFTRDGLSWQLVSDPDVAQAVLRRVARTSDGYVLFGVEWLDNEPVGRSWTSSDGREWTPDDGPEAQAVANGLLQVVATPEKLVAFVQDKSEPREGRRQVQTWNHGRAGWRLVGTLPESAGADVWQAAAGPKGWVAVGGRYRRGYLERFVAWTSTDGIEWHQAPTAPGIDNLGDILADPSGFIAVGYLQLGQGCALDETDIRGQTWTSADGLTWRSTDDDAWHGRRIDVLLRNGRTLIGLGTTYERGWQGTAWSAVLPAQSLDDGPAPAAAQPIQNRGCGA